MASVDCVYLHLLITLLFPPLLFPLPIQFSLTVDGIYTQHGSVAGSIPYFISKVFYVGGGIGNGQQTPPPKGRGEISSSQFVGCLRKV